MGHARRSEADPTRDIRYDDGDNDEVMDADAVLEHLEAARPDHDDGADPIRGIVNGVMIGTAVWVVLVVAAIAFS